MRAVIKWCVSCRPVLPESARHGWGIVEFDHALAYSIGSYWYVSRGADLTIHALGQETVTVANVRTVDSNENVALSVLRNNYQFCQGINITQVGNESDTLHVHIVNKKTPFLILGLHSVGPPFGIILPKVKIKQKYNSSCSKCSSSMFDSRRPSLSRVQIAEPAYSRQFCEFKVYSYPMGTWPRRDNRGSWSVCSLEATTPSATAKYNGSASGTCQKPASLCSNLEAVRPRRETPAAHPSRPHIGTASSAGKDGNE